MPASDADAFLFERPIKPTLFNTTWLRCRHSKTMLDTVNIRFQKEKEAQTKKHMNIELK